MKKMKQDSSTAARMISASITVFFCWAPRVRASVIRLSMRRGFPCLKLCVAANEKLNFGEENEESTF